MSNRVYSVAITKLAKLSGISSSLGELALTNGIPRSDANLALVKKASIDREVVATLDKVAGILDSLNQITIPTSMEALKPYLASAGKGLAFGAGVAIPTALVGKYLMNSARDAASDTLTSTVDNTLGRVIHRGRQYLGMEPMDTSKQRSKTSELDIAYSLNTKLRNAGFDGVKTAADSAYISDVITRSNAHVSDILNTLLN